MNPSDYNIGWIALLSLELTAARHMLDVEHEEVTDIEYRYIAGKIGDHDVVIGIQSKMGTSAAADLAARMRRATAQQATPTRSSWETWSSPVTGVVPRGLPHSLALHIYIASLLRSYSINSVLHLFSPTIRDISSPRGNHGGVFTYGTGAWVKDGQLSNTGHLNGPPPELSAAVGSLRSRCVAVMQCSKRPCVLFCCVVLLVLCSQRGCSRVCLHNVSLMYTCAESAHGLERRALGQCTWHT
jgi:hypothetical protein